MNKVIAVILICITTSLGYSQSDEAKRHEISAGLVLSSRGGIPSGFNLQYLYKQTRYKGIGFKLEFMNVKDRREVKYPITGTQSFIYQKLNSLISIRPDLVISRNLFVREKENGLKVDYKLMVGPSFGLVKPYYLKFCTGIPDGNGNVFCTDVYYATYDEVNPGAYLIGSTNILFKLNTAKWIAGLNLAGSLTFELTKSADFFWGLELGYQLELYPSGVQILNDDEEYFFPFLYLNIYGGGRK